MLKANELTIHNTAAFAEDEAKRISQCTKDALAAAKIHGVELDKVGAANLPPNVDQRQAEADSFAERLRPIFIGMAARQLTQRAMVIELNQVGMPAPHGGISDCRRSSEFLGGSKVEAWLAE
jgi:DNA invertase Pin-like site-specific DNA recombinase